MVKSGEWSQKYVFSWLPDISPLSKVDDLDCCLYEFSWLKPNIVLRSNAKYFGQILLLKQTK